MVPMAHRRDDLSGPSYNREERGFGGEQRSYGSGQRPYRSYQPRQDYKS